ncbi:carbonic anhydrase-like isoform X1 [Montipora capricornis]|uniref:carbonic anhydrase-like isoform X1 n=1 Tax=Montipora capricornis TaxID=246305 RepID=UPI0035F12B1F
MGLLLLLTVFGAAASLKMIPYEKFKYGQTDGEVLGPSDWADRWPQCNSSRQSPINIKGATNQWYGFLTMTFDNWGGLVTGTLQNTRHFPKLNIDTGQGAQLRGGPLRGTYTLKQFHFHFGCTNSRGSEHTLNGTRFSGELHLVFQKTTAPEDFAVVALWVKAPSPRGNVILERLANLTRDIIKPDAETTVGTSDGIFIRDLIPRACLKFFFFSKFIILKCFYYTYKGSLTTPPCSESVTWLIVEPWLVASNNTMEKFRRLESPFGKNPPLMCDNYRPLQPLNNRRVFYVHQF